MKSLIKLILILLALGLIFFLINRENTKTDNAIPTATTTTSTTTNVNIEDFVSQNISNLSPIKEQVGGKFYVTSITANGGTGTVEFEDGHNAYIADFTYQTDIAGKVSVLSFKLR